MPYPRMFHLYRSVSRDSNNINKEYVEDEGEEAGPDREPVAVRSTAISVEVA